MSRKINLSRRRFLRNAALGAAAVPVIPILGRSAYGANQGIPGRFVVVINLLGGNDGMNMVAPAHLTPYIERRPNINLVEHVPVGEQLHDLDGRYKLHYSLDNLKSMWDASQLHIVQKVSYPSPNQSHFTSQDIWSYGVRDNFNNGDGRGWLGRYADIFCPGDPLGVISVGFAKRHDFESQNTSPLILTSVSSGSNPVSTFQVERDTEFSADYDERLQAVKDILATDPVPPQDPALSIYSANKQAYSLVDQVASETQGWTDPGTYATNEPLGRNMRAISQLLHAHDTFKTRVFYTGLGGFDTHTEQHTDGPGTNRHQTLMQRLDAAIAAFKADMESRNKWSSCVIIVISEFGRRIYENGSTGTDHGHGNCVLVCGGQVKGKLQAGSGMTGDITEAELTPNPGQNPISGNPNTLPFQYDFRDIYTELMQGHLGHANVAASLFPDPTYTPAPGDIDLV